MDRSEGAERSHPVSPPPLDKIVPRDEMVDNFCAWRDATARTVLWERGETTRAAEQAQNVREKAHRRRVNLSYKMVGRENGRAERGVGTSESDRNERQDGEWRCYLHLWLCRCFDNNQRPRNSEKRTSPCASRPMLPFLSGPSLFSPTSASIDWTWLRGHLAPGPYQPNPHELTRQMTIGLFGFQLSYFFFLIFNIVFICCCFWEGCLLY